MRDYVERINTAWRSEEPAYRYSLLALLLAGVAIRAAFLFQPLRYDEGITYLMYASRPLSVGLSNYLMPNNHLLNTMLIHFSTRLFGSSVWAIRLPDFIAGALVLPATYLVVRKLYNKWAALIATALAVPSFLLVAYSTDARGYMLQALVFLVMIVLALRVKRMRSGWVPFAILAALAFFDMPTSLYFVGALVVWMLLSALLGDTWEPKYRFISKLAASCLGAAVLTFLLYLPVITNTGISSITSDPWFASLPWHVFAGQLPVHLSDTWASWNHDLPIVLTVLLVVGFLASIILHRRMARDRVNLALVIIGWSALVFFAQRSVPFVRTWVPLVPLYLGFASAGLYYVGARAIAWARARWKLPAVSASLPVIVVLVLCLFLTAMVYAGQSPYQTSDTGTPNLGVFRDARKVARALKPVLRPGDLVFAEGAAEAVMEYYFLQYGIPLGYLAWNVSDAEVASPVRRAFAVEGFGEGHTLSAATRTAVGFYDVRLFEKFNDSRIFVVQVGPPS